MQNLHSFVSPVLSCKGVLYSTTCMHLNWQFRFSTLLLDLKIDTFFRMIFIYLPTLLYTIEHVVIIVSLQWTIVGLANFETFNSIYFWQRTTSFSLHVPCLKKNIFHSPYCCILLLLMLMTTFLDPTFYTTYKNRYC